MTKKFVPHLVSILTTSPKKGERQHFTKRVKEEVLKRQKGKCSKCQRSISRWELDFDHKNGDRSNNDLSNCQALHTRCHRKKHAADNNSHSKSLLKRWFL
jgi:5-methylcytosine-specific restriction endonuclease McrA